MSIMIVTNLIYIWQYQVEKLEIMKLRILIFMAPNEDRNFLQIKSKLNYFAVRRNKRHR